MDISNNSLNKNDKGNDNYNEKESEIKVIMRQTTYTREECEKLLIELGSVEKCIAHYLGIEPKGEPQISTNQKIFKSIRDFF